MLRKSGIEWRVCSGCALAGAAVFAFVPAAPAAMNGTTIEVSPDQRVVSSGPYAWVRHPMYSSVLVTFLGAPLALGCWWGGIVLIPLIALIAWRLIAEERFLEENLSGYRSYCERVSYRLLPGVW